MNSRISSSMSGLPERFAAYIWRDEPFTKRWQAAPKAALRLIWAVGRDLGEGQLTLRAMSLVYTTLLSLVPLLAISFSILKGFGVHNQVEPFLLNILEPLGERRTEIAAKVVAFVDNVQVGVLGSVGFLLLFYTVVSLMQKIETAFNEVWQAAGTRSLTERFRDYLSVIVVGPALVFASLGITATVMSDPLMQQFSGIESLRLVLEFLGRLVPTLMVALAFTFIYLFVPHTRVRVLPAFTGGLVAGVMWNALGWLFAAFVGGANNYTAIYSGFATPILFMIWLYVGWLILLIGATIAFYRQHPEYLAGRQPAQHLSFADREELALQAIRLIGRRYYSGDSPPGSEWLASKLGIPASLLGKVLDPLEQAGLLARSAAEDPAYLPGCPWESTTLDKVFNATRRAGRSASRRAIRPVDDAEVAALMRQHDEMLRSAYAETTLKEVAIAQQHGEEFADQDQRRSSSTR